MKHRTMWLAVLLAGMAAAQDVKVDYDQKTDFSRYHTYAWRRAQAVKSGNAPALERMERAVNDELAKKGMHESGGVPDALFECRLATRERLERHAVGGPAVIGPRGRVVRRRGVVVDDYTQGTVVIDMLDARTKELLWHARAQDKGDSPIEAMSEKNLRKIAEKAFKKFPRKKGS